MSTHGSDAWLVQKNGWREPASALSIIVPIQDSGTPGLRYDRPHEHQDVPTPSCEGKHLWPQAQGQGTLPLSYSYSAKQDKIIAATLTEHVVDWICSYTDPTNPVHFWDETVQSVEGKIWC